MNLTVFTFCRMPAEAPYLRHLQSSTRQNILDHSAERIDVCCDEAVTSIISPLYCDTESPFIGKSAVNTMCLQVVLTVLDGSVSIAGRTWNIHKCLDLLDSFFYIWISHSVPFFLE